MPSTKLDLLKKSGKDSHVLSVLYTRIAKESSVVAACCWCMRNAMLSKATLLIDTKFKCTECLSNAQTEEQ